MNDTMQEFVVKLKDMMGAAGLPHKHADKVFEDAAANKAGINKILGLNEDNGYRKEILLDMSDADFDKAHPNARQIFDRIPGWDGGWSPTSGKITVGRDKVNITKFLAKQLQEKAIEPVYIKYLYDLLKIDPDNPKAESQIVPKFGELINKKADNAVIISTNPFDMFTSSAQDYKYAAFRSCFRPGGEYFNGCNSFSRDPFTTIAYKASIKKPDYKHGRAWMFVLDEIVAQTKSYGTFTGNERRVARSFAEACVAANLGVNPAEFKSHRVGNWKQSMTANRNVLYFDDYEIDLGYLTSRFTRFTDNDVPMLKFSHARCLKCGRETLYPQHGICGVCSGNYSACAECDTEIMGDVQRVSVNGKYYCTHCAEKSFDLCTDCGKYHDRGTGIAVTGSICVCPTCINKNYYKCGSCGEMHRNRNAHHAVSTGEVSDIWCSACYDKKAFRCLDCGTKHPNTNKTTIADTTGALIDVCGTCAEQYHVCVDCNITYKGGFESKSGSICMNCYTNYEYCIHCDTVVKKAEMVFDGEKVSCSACASKKEATTTAYVEEIAEILKGIVEIEDKRRDTEAEIVNMILADREQNGYSDGDIVRIIKNDSWHSFKNGDLVVVSKTTYVNASGSAVYASHIADSTWHICAGDIELARPAICIGDVICIDGVEQEVTGVAVTSTGELTYSINGANNVPSSSKKISYVDLINLKDVKEQTQYNINDTLVICGNTSRHGFNPKDIVKVYRKDVAYGLQRFFVKKGKNIGVIYGVDIDTTKVYKAAKPAIKRAPKKPTW